ncbi:hypothetical protein L6164_013314 [Bauhinia variegata]|uniref:Uncharacterized protein n=1 Tax=Bauhinia variegata TaxID=167791 RepID=A0ACB9PFH1_BAUVA|nr:hypothetical protein L6164_013314 [Bauhinia variegata]
MLIVTEKLNGVNYREWAQAIKLAIGGRGKMGFIARTANISDGADPQATQQWHTENLLVSSWLINAMAPEIKQSFMFLPSAHEIWEAVHDSYCDGKDMAKLFEIKTKIWEMKQGDRDMTAYWLEISALCHILSRTPLPSTREVFSEVRREASQRKVMLYEAILVPPNPSTDSAALVSRSSTTNERGQRERPFCDHCKKTGHTRDTCWEIHGKPADWKPQKGKPRGYQTSQDHTHEQLEGNSGPQIDKDQLAEKGVSKIAESGDGMVPKPITSVHLENHDTEPEKQQQQLENQQLEKEMIVYTRKKKHDSSKLTVPEAQPVSDLMRAPKTSQMEDTS